MRWEVSIIEKIRKWRNKHLSKVKFYDRTLWKNYLYRLGAVGTILTVISFFAAARDIDIKLPWWAIGVIILALICYFCYMLWKANHASEVELRINKTKVVIRQGDIFGLLEKPVDERQGEISIIAANDYFDTIVDDRIVARKTLHGQYVKRIEEAGKLAALNQAISDDEIINKAGSHTETSGRHKGKTVKYRIGSVVEFESYVLAAFTTFDANNKATVSAEEYTGFWMRFWENIDEIYAGRTINFPLVGAGITRFKNGKPSKQELLEIMLWSMKISGFHNTYSDRQINILIHEYDMNEIDLYHIQHNQSFK